MHRYALALAGPHARLCPAHDMQRGHPSSDSGQDRPLCGSSGCTGDDLVRVPITYRGRTMSTLNTQVSFQWMIPVGVDASDVEWLERMHGSKELHQPEAASRVERIYTVAMAGVLASDAPERHLMMALN